MSSVEKSTVLRVLQITVRADMGGGPRHVLDLLRSCVDTNVENYVAAPSGEVFSSQLRDLAKKFLTIPHRKFSAFCLFRMILFIKMNGIELIHSHGRGAGYYSRILGFFTGKPVIHTFHGVHAETSAAGRIKTYVDRLFAEFPFFAIFVSSEEKRDAESAGFIQSQPSVILPNGVDLTRFPGPARSREEINRIGTFLRPATAKGPDLFLRMAAESTSRPYTFECAGVEKAALLKIGHVPENVVPLGIVAEPADWLDSLDLYVSTSRQEGLPIGVLEALVTGVPCVLSRISAHMSLIDAGYAKGLDLDQPLGLQLQSLTSRVRELALMAERGRAYARATFSLSTFSKNLLSIYQAAMDFKGEGVFSTKRSSS